MDISALLLDVDGVLTQGNAAVPDAPAALRSLAERGVPFRIVTNTSQRSRATLARRLNVLGFAVEPSTIFSPAVAAARYLTEHGQTAYLATRDDVKSDFREMGVALDDREPDVVVLGDLGEDLTYAELNHVLRYLLGGSELVALGGTRYWHAADGPALDVGPFAALFAHATGVTPRVLGKPDPAVFGEAARALGVRLDDLAMVGDDAEVDVGAAKRAGLGAGILVQTGKYRPGDEARHSPPPDAVYPSFPAFVQSYLER
jgi:HAD superfamily hydrolase (TIGR01458 family)